MRKSSGFTVLELLVATTVLILLLVILLSVTNTTVKTVSAASFKVEAFGSGRVAQDILTQRLSQATLNTYWDYYDAQGNSRSSSLFTSPAAFGRVSDLQFVVIPNTQTSATAGQEIYFQTPEAYSTQSTYSSTQGLLNTCGFFVRYGDDNQFRPSGISTSLIPNRYRYRLMQVMQPTEKFSIYKNAASPPTWTSSLSDPSGDNAAYIRPVADNVIAMVIWPRLSALDDSTGLTLSADYSYDSKNYSGSTGFKSATANQLPPILNVTLIVIDEKSAVRLDTNSSTPPAVISSALANKFTKVSNYQSDIDAISTALTNGKVNFRILNTSIVLRESKWSN